jgi:hypothetical protein
MDLMAASLPDAQANSRTAQSAAAARRAGGACRRTWPGRQARIIREIWCGEASDDALSNWAWRLRGATTNSRIAVLLSARVVRNSQGDGCFQAISKIIEFIAVIPGT